jgi:ParB/RepB/Spo0J family partition protein
MLTRTKPRNKTAPRRIAVISGDETSQTQRLDAAQNAAVLIPLDWIETNPLNPREEFDDDKLRSLAASFRHVQLLHPIHVEPADELGSRFRLVAGERRYRAAKLAGWKTIPSVICEPGQAPKIIAAENIERENLNPIEKARSLRLLTLPTKQGGAGMTTTEVAAFLGKSQPWVSGLTRLLKLPDEWRARVAKGEISTHSARRILQVVKRSDVLQAVEADYTTNPDDWRTTQDFERRVSAIIQGLDGLSEPSNGPDAEQAEIDAETISGATAARRAVAVRHEAPGPEANGKSNADSNIYAVQAAVELIRELQNIEDLDRVQEALDARRQALEGGREKPCRT